MAISMSNRRESYMKLKLDYSHQKLQIKKPQPSPSRPLKNAAITTSQATQTLSPLLSPCSKYKNALI
jgi:hypothetical protein